MIRKNLQALPISNSNSGKSQQLQLLNLEQLDSLAGGDHKNWIIIESMSSPIYR